MAPRDKPTVSKRMSTDTLLELTDKVAAELARRIEELQEGQQKLGVEGLRLNARGMKAMVVQFPRSSSQYAYDVPVSAEIGDTVQTPTSYHGGPSLATIVAEGAGCYTGPRKEVLNLYKKVN